MRRSFQNIHELQGPRVVATLGAAKAELLNFLRNPRLAARRARDQSLHRNSVFMMSVTIFTSLFGFVYWLVAARAYGTSQLGLAAALVTAMTLASMLTNLGINTALVQILPQQASGDPWSASMNAGLLVGLASSLVGGVVAVLGLPLVSSQFDRLSGSFLYSLTFVVGVVATTLTNLLDYACVAERQAGRMLVRNVAFSVVKIPLVVLPFVVGLGSYGILVSWVLSTVAILLVMFLLLPRLDRGYRIRARGVGGELGRLRRYLAGHHAMNIGAFAPWWLLPLLVTAEISATADAYFYAAWRIVGIVYMIAPAVGQSLAAEGAAAPERLWEHAASSARFTAALLVPAFIGLAVIGPLALLAFGPRYLPEAFPLLLLFAAASFPDALMSIYTGVLRVQGRLRLGGSVQLGTAAIALAGTAALLPIIGITGAGVAWLVSRLVGSAAIALNHRHDWRSAAVAPAFEGASRRPVAISTETTEPTTSR